MVRHPTTGITLRGVMSGDFSWATKNPLREDGTLSEHALDWAHTRCEDIHSVVPSFNGRLLDQSWHAPLLAIETDDLK